MYGFLFLIPHPTKKEGAVYTWPTLVLALAVALGVAVVLAIALVLVLVLVLALVLAIALVLALALNPLTNSVNYCIQILHWPWITYKFESAHNLCKPLYWKLG